MWNFKRKAFDEILNCSIALSKFETFDLKQLLAKYFDLYFKDSYETFQKSSILLQNSQNSKNKELLLEKLLNEYVSSRSLALKIYNSLLGLNDELLSAKASVRLDNFRLGAMGRIQPHITIEFFVRRTSVLESTKAGIRKIEDDKEDYCNRRLYIKFINELGIVEAGADAGGLTREFFPLVFREIYALGHLFEQVGEKAKYIHIKPLEEDKVTKDLLEEYRFVGKMIGLAILNKNPLPEPSISSALFSLLLEFPETWRLLKEIDLSMFEMWDREYM